MILTVNLTAPDGWVVQGVTKNIDRPEPYVEAHLFPPEHLRWAFEIARKQTMDYPAGTQIPTWNGSDIARLGDWSFTGLKAARYEQAWSSAENYKPGESYHPPPFVWRDLNYGYPLWQAEVERTMSPAEILLWAVDPNQNSSNRLIDQAWIDDYTRDRRDR